MNWILNVGLQSYFLNFNYFNFWTLSPNRTTFLKYRLNYYFSYEYENTSWKLVLREFFKTRYNHWDFPLFSLILRLYPNLKGSRNKYNADISIIFDELNSIHYPFLITLLKIIISKIYFFIFKMVHFRGNLH